MLISGLLQRKSRLKGVAEQQILVIRLGFPQLFPPKTSRNTPDLTSDFPVLGRETCGKSDVSDYAVSRNDLARNIKPHWGRLRD